MNAALPHKSRFSVPFVNLPTEVVQAGMIVVLAAVYPVMMIAMIAPVKNLPPERFGSGPAASRKKSAAAPRCRSTSKP